MTYKDNRLQDTLDEGKHLWQLVSQYAKLELVDKLSFVLTILIVGGVLLALCAVAIYCFCMFLVTQMAEATGNLALSYCIMGVALLAIAAIVVLARKSLVVNPVIKALMKEFFDDSSNHNSNETQGR